MIDFFSFGRKASSDPLSSLKSVTLWMNALPLGDVYAAHEKVVKALVEFNDKQAPFSRERLDVLMHLDEHAREMQRALCQQYLRNPRMSKVIESRLWNSVHSFYWEVTRGYHAFIMDYVAHPGGSKIKAQIPLITARAIHDFARMFKWCSFRYEDVDERLWKRLHNLYRFAEFERFEREAMTLHQGDEAPSSCAEQYVHALMLDTASTGAFYPKQIELLDFWLTGWARMLPLERAYEAERHVYCVNTQEGQGARRIRKVEDDENCRFWGTRELIAHIEETRAQLLNGEAPARLGLSEDCRLPACLDFLDDIARMWAPKVQRVQRKHERNRVMQMIEVVHGLPDICAEIKQDNENSRQLQDGEQAVALTYEEMVDVKLYGFITKRTQAKQETNGKAGNHVALQLPVHERWVVENESDSGYGATIDEVANDWVRLGKLVGLKPERTSHWRVGIVRRMHNHAATQHYVGIEIISDTPVTVLLRPRQPKTSSGYLVNGVDAVNVILPIAAVFMPGNGGGGERGTLIIDSAEFSSGRLLELGASSKSYLIRLKDVLEKGDDWLQCGFDVISKA